MTLRQHGIRVGLLTAGVAALLGWLTGRAEVTFADGLRYLHQAERIDRGEWASGLLHAVDHPLHPIAMVAAHRVLGGHGPVAWQHAAQAASIGAVVLLVIPFYLVGLELYDPDTAWVGCVLFFANPMIGYVVVNVLSETTFLLFWTWGLWGAIRFLREGRFGWLLVTVALASLSYLARPEGLLLPLALTATLLISPWHWSTRLPWPRWWSATAFLILAPIALVGPYMAVKGGLGTKPSIARLIGTAPESPPLALERDKPTPPGQSAARTYWLSFRRVNKVLKSAVRWPLLPFLLVGIVLAWSAVPHGRLWVFQVVIVLAATAALVRLHATGGYCTVRHALVPGMLLILAGAHGVASLLRSVVFDGRWVLHTGEYYRPGPVLWVIVLAGLTVIPLIRVAGAEPGGFAVYHDVGAWIAQRASGEGRLLDVTDWSLFFSGRSGYIFADVYEGTADPATRWVIVQDAHVQGHWHYSALLRRQLAGLNPVASFPEHPRPGRLRIRIYDRRERPVAAVVSDRTPVQR